MESYNFAKDFEITTTTYKTSVVVISKKNGSPKNLTKISCSQGVSIEGYLYDAQTQNYLIDCDEFLNLGYIPVSLWLSIKGVGKWNQRIPLSESAIEFYLDPHQKKDLEYFKSSQGEDCSFSFIQFVDCNL